MYISVKETFCCHLEKEGGGEIRRIFFMNNSTIYTLGIDIGSTTVKVAILNEKQELLFSDYEHHFANIQETLASLLEKAEEIGRASCRERVFEPV